MESTYFFRSRSAALRGGAMVAAWLVVGALLIWVSSRASGFWETLAQYGGGAVLGTVAMSFIFQNFQRKALQMDRFESDLVAGRWKRSRLAAFFWSLYDLPWEPLFKNSKELRVVVAYRRTWRVREKGRIRDLLKRGGRVNVVLTSPCSDSSVSEYGRKFHVDATDVKSEVGRTKTAFEELAEELGKKNALRTVWSPKTCLFSLYLFDDGGVFESFNHRQSLGENDRGNVVLVAERGGALYEWMEREWEAALEMANREIEEKGGENAEEKGGEKGGGPSVEGAP